MKCKCRAGFEAMGLPDCAPVPERIVRVLFTTELTAQEAFSDLFPTPVWAADLPDWTGDPIPAGMWKLITPVADLVESDRPDPVREEIGGNSYFVRYSPRSLTFTFARKPAELGRMLAQLRCAQTLGVFLVDAAGVVWGRRVPPPAPGAPDWMAPLPVMPSTVTELMQFAGDTTVQKWVFSFQLQTRLADYDLIPIWSGESILSYQPPIHVQAKQFGPNVFTIYARFSRGGTTYTDHYIPITALSPLPYYYDASGTPLVQATSADFQHTGDGLWQITPPSDAVYVAFTPTQLAAAITPNGFNWYDFRIDL